MFVGSAGTQGASSERRGQIRLFEVEVALFRDSWLARSRQPARALNSLI